MTGVFDRFTDDARLVIVVAQQEALRRNHRVVAAEHILLGLVAKGESGAAKALESMRVSLEAVRHEVEAAIGRTGTGTTTAPQFGASAKKVLELSLREALGLGHTYIGTEHLLLGVVREGDAAARVLVSLGAGLARARQQVLSQLPLASGPAPTGDDGELDAGEQPRSAGVPRWKADILQVMFWLHEEFGEALSPPMLTRWLGTSGDVVRRQVDQLAAEGLVACDEESWQLTARGLAAGRTQFLSAR